MSKALFRKLGTAIGVAVPLLFAGKASAQEWLKDRRFSEGAGIRTGDVELHPGVAAEVGFDSNYFYRSHKGPDPSLVNADPNAPVRPAGVLRLTPQFSIGTLGGQRREEARGGDLPPLTWRLNTSLSLLKLLGKEVSDQTDPLNAYGNINGRIDIAPGRPFGVGIFGGYTRTLQAAAIGNPDQSFNRSDVNGGLELIALPGGGTLDLRLGYQFYGALFEQTQGVPFTNMQHELSARNRWKFRPRTALFHDTTLRFVHYPNRDRSINTLHDSTPLRTHLGLNGLVTPRLALLVSGGYGASFHSGGNPATVRQYDSFLAQVQATFFLTGNPEVTEPGAMSLALSSLAVGYNRDFANSYLGDFYGIDRGYVQLFLAFGGKFLMTLTSGVAGYTYPVIFTNTGPGNTPVLVNQGFTDLHLDNTLYGEYRFTDVFAMMLTLKYDQNISDQRLPAGQTVGGAPGFYDLNWQRFQAMLGARLFW
jgi:hypothetical protein